MLCIIYIYILNGIHVSGHSCINHVTWLIQVLLIKSLLTAYTIWLNVTFVTASNRREWPSNFNGSLRHVLQIQVHSHGSAGLLYGRWRKSMENPKIWPQPLSNPISDSHKSWQRWFIVDPYTCAKVRHDPSRGFVFVHSWPCAQKRVSFLGWSNYLQPRPLDGFLCNISQNALPRQVCAFSGSPT